MPVSRLTALLVVAFWLSLPGTGRAFSAPRERSDLWLGEVREAGFAVEYSVTTGPDGVCPSDTGDRPLRVTVRSARPSEHGYSLELSFVVCASLWSPREGWADAGQPQQLFLIDRAGRRREIEGRFDVRTEHCSTCCACLVGSLDGRFGPRGRRRRVRAEIRVNRGSSP